MKRSAGERSVLEEQAQFVADTVLVVLGVLVGCRFRLRLRSPARWFASYAARFVTGTKVTWPR
jgi:hypothetical protein